MIRNAKVTDTETIQEIVNLYAKNGDMLSLSLNEIFERLYEFVVWEDNGSIIGVCALHPTWNDVAEIRSLAVISKYHKNGIGLQLVKHLLNKAKDVGFKKVFTLTYKEEFFRKAGFSVTDIETLPKKIWTDCLKCIKYPDCDEIAMIINI